MVTTEEINKIVGSLKKGAPGYDEITVDTLRLSLDILNEPLCYLCNRSLIEGVFPNEMKLANVLPLFKSGDPMLFNNYRPVSLLCVLSKVFEKAMYSRLLSFIENHNLLFQYQFGFRQMHSSYMALMIMMDKITAAMDRGDLVVGIFLDFSKAFDTVNHEILIDKLYHYGIRGTALDWFKSYLCNHRQFITYNSVSSNTKVISCGVPQGSILGPLLFFIYRNDLFNMSKESAPISFADDTNLFFCGKQLSELESHINDELCNISGWLKANKLSLNISKTHIVFNRKKNIDTKLKIHIDNQDIEEVLSTKFLGVIIDSKLTWKQHISHISGKIARSIGMIIKAKYYLNKNALLALYYSFVYPYFTYCNHVWGCTYSTNLDNLYRLQKKTNKDYIQHSKTRVYQSYI